MCESCAYRFQIKGSAHLLQVPATCNQVRNDCCCKLPLMLFCFILIVASLRLAASMIMPLTAFWDKLNSQQAKFKLLMESNFQLLQAFQFKK